MTSRAMEPMEDDAIGALYREWADAFRHADVDRVLNLITPDYVLWASGMAPMTRDVLRGMLEAAFAAYQVEPAFEREEQVVRGDIAFERGWDVQTVRPRIGGDVQVRRQRVFLLLQRGPDGAWRFARGMSQPGPRDA
jgi:uncharacterized protein (TIGR02246 family)